MVYPALLPLMRTPRLPVIDWTDAPADLNGLVHFAEIRNLVSARVPSHFNWPLPIVWEAGWASEPVWTGVENLAPTGIRSPDRPARSESLYRLRYPSSPIYIHTYIYVYIFNAFFLNFGIAFRYGLIRLEKRVARTDKQEMHAYSLFESCKGRSVWEVDVGSDTAADFGLKKSCTQVNWLSVTCCSHS
jgi:hypothetical protein